MYLTNWLSYSENKEMVASITPIQSLPKGIFTDCFHSLFLFYPNFLSAFSSFFWLYKKSFFQSQEGCIVTRGTKPPFNFFFSLLFVSFIYSDRNSFKITSKYWNSKEWENFNVFDLTWSTLIAAPPKHSTFPSVKLMAKRLMKKYLFCYLTMS